MRDSPLFFLFFAHPHPQPIGDFFLGFEMLLRFQGYIPFRFVLCDNEGPYLFSLLVSLFKKNRKSSFCSSISSTLVYFETSRKR